MNNGRTFLLGIDPGLATGVAYINYTDADNPQVEWSDEKSVEQFHEFIEIFLSQHKDICSVVIEDYIITERTAKLSQQPWSLRLIGVVAYLCWKYNIPLTLQKPRDKEFADNKKLQRIKFWHVGGEGHANDAFKHCLVWLVQRNPRVAKHLVK